MCALVECIFIIERDAFANRNNYIAVSLLFDEGKKLMRITRY